MLRSLLCLLLVSILALTPSSVTANAGDLDMTFGKGGRVVRDFFNNGDAALDVALQPDGRIVAGGFATESSTGRNFALVRYNTDGTPDTTFGVDGVVIELLSDGDDQINAIALLPDGSILCAGGIFNSATDFDFVLARYTASGGADLKFGINGKVTTDFANSEDICFGLAIQPDGKIIVVGRIRISPDLQSDFGIARYNPDGSLDMSFGSGGKQTTDFFGELDIARDVALQGDGRIVVAGQASIVGGANFALARYDVNGSLDPTFGTGGKVTTIFPGTSGANALKLQPDGKIVIAGETFNLSLGNPDFALARYDSGGNLDPAFGSGGKVTTDFTVSQDIATSLFIQSNGKMIAAGETQNISTGLSACGLVRYNSDGSLDSTFGNGGKVTSAFGFALAAVLGLAIQTDGKIVTAGSGLIGPSAAAAEFLIARYEGDGLTGSISPGSAFFSALGGEGEVEVTAPQALNWTAISNDIWITITSAATGAGNGSMTYVVRDNNSPFPRQGTITIAGSTFVVTQDSNAGSSCNSKISPTFETFNATGGNGAINITTGAQCAWQAVSNSSWINIASTCCGIGSGTVSYTVTANTTGASRRGTIMVAGRTFSVKQLNN